MEPVLNGFQEMEAGEDPLDLDCSPRFGPRVSVPTSPCGSAQEPGLSFPVCESACCVLLGSCWEGRESCPSEARRLAGGVAAALGVRKSPTGSQASQAAGSTPFPAPLGAAEGAWMGQARPPYGCGLCVMMCHPGVGCWDQTSGPQILRLPPSGGSPT